MTETPTGPPDDEPGPEGGQDPATVAILLDETTRNLEARGVRTSRLRELLERTFASAMVSANAASKAKVPDEISVKDRHVVGSALAGAANVVVTFNVRDFPQDVLAPLGLLVQTPDEFLMDLLSNNQNRVVEVVKEQAAQLRKPALSLEALAAHVPKFVEQVRPLLTAEDALGSPPATPTP